MSLNYSDQLSIPKKAPGNYEIMAPIDFWMMPPPWQRDDGAGSWGMLAAVSWRLERRLVKR
ncbi:hypothetical protein CCR94_13815 [Rhodoblastus sphagnicola]|uniref:Uncharacterized protein n=1 Tax=Rhodoblastus sphagnicola TaxID=333368 RepID=A0A2S6N5N1_9HYPH|nr:hypothetical protein CCR94_13815 [Rhodoblastus sphagnicola]